MERNDIIKSAKASFKANDTIKTLFVTKDGMCFPNDHDAKNHEKYLGPHDKGIAEFTRDGIEKEGEKAKAKDAKELGAGTDGEKDGKALAASTKTEPAPPAPGEGKKPAEDAKPAEEVAAPKKAAKKAAKKAGKKK